MDHPPTSPPRRRISRRVALRFKHSTKRTFVSMGSAAAPTAAAGDESLLRACSSSCWPDAVVVVGVVVEGMVTVLLVLLVLLALGVMLVIVLMVVLVVVATGPLTPAAFMLPLPPPLAPGSMPAVTSLAATVLLLL
jgi:hypothetical protein